MMHVAQTLEMASGGREESAQHAEELQATVTLQAWARGHAARKEVARLRLQERALAEDQAAATLQAWVRGRSARRAAAEMRQASRLHEACKLQALWRGRQGRLRALAARAAGVAAAKAEAAARAAAQAHAAVTLQRAVRGWLQQRSFHRSMRALIRLQARWRGLLVRRAADTWQREARRRVQAAAEVAEAHPHLRLGTVTQSALDVLLASTSLTHVLDATSSTEAAASDSADCCRLIAQRGGATSLLRFVRSFNRSKVRAAGCSFPMTVTTPDRYAIGLQGVRFQ